ncbi:MAG TPA: hypothetical protein VF331_22505 [Polyangiales bacterium]
MDAVMRSGATRGLLGLILVCAASACIGVSPEQRLAQDLGPDTGPYDTGPYHRAGFPCTNCHGDLWWQDHPTFELAGTVYRTPTDDQGQDGAVVSIQDATGKTITAQTNAVGNFFLVNGGTGTFRGSNQGSTVISGALVYPLRVSVKAGSAVQQMRGLIWRERSCANCHDKRLGAGSNGRVFVQESSP